jgi:hypothetical protein
MRLLLDLYKPLLGPEGGQYEGSLDRRVRTRDAYFEGIGGMDADAACMNCSDRVRHHTRELDWTLPNTIRIVGFVVCISVFILSFILSIIFTISGTTLHPAIPPFDCMCLIVDSQIPL